MIIGEDGKDMCKFVSITKYMLRIMFKMFFFFQGGIKDQLNTNFSKRFLSGKHGRALG